MFDYIDDHINGLRDKLKAELMYDENDTKTMSVLMPKFKHAVIKQVIDYYLIPYNTTLYHPRAWFF